MKRFNIALIYNTHRDGTPESPEDRSGMADLRKMIRHMARSLRKLKHHVTVVPLANDLPSFQRRLARLKPDVVFNQYDDVVHGALFEMRVAAFVRMMGYPLTGSPALALGLSRYKYMCASLLQGANVPIPPNTELIERVGDVNDHSWQWPVIAQPGREHAGVGLDRDSVVTSKKALRAKVAHILRTYNQPALVQHFLPGREFNVGLVGGTKLRVMPLAEAIFEDLPPGIPPIMSYAAKWIETSVEYQRTYAQCPADVEPDLARRIEDTALRAFRAIGGWGYGRVDIRLDEEGIPRVLEVNCNPCLDDGIGLARSAERAGIDYPHLLDLVVRASLEARHPDWDVPMFNLPAAAPHPVKRPV